MATIIVVALPVPRERLEAGTVTVVPGSATAQVSLGGVDVSDSMVAGFIEDEAVRRFEKAWARLCTNAHCEASPVRV